MLDAIQLKVLKSMMIILVMVRFQLKSGNRDMTKYHKDIMKKFRPKVMTQEKLVGGQKKLDKIKMENLTEQILQC